MAALDEGAAELCCFGLIPLKLKGRGTKDNNPQPCNYTATAVGDRNVQERTKTASFISQLIENLLVLFKLPNLHVCMCVFHCLQIPLSVCIRGPDSPAGPLSCQSTSPVVCLSAPVISRFSHLAIVSPICSTLSNLLLLPLQVPHVVIVMCLIFSLFHPGGGCTQRCFIASWKQKLWACWTLTPSGVFRRLQQLWIQFFSFFISLWLCPLGHIRPSLLQERTGDCEEGCLTLYSFKIFWTWPFLETKHPKHVSQLPKPWERDLAAQLESWCRSWRVFGQPRVTLSWIILALLWHEGIFQNLHPRFQISGKLNVEKI